MAGAQSPWVRRRRIELADLVNEPWALPPPESATGSVAMEAFRASGLDYPRATVFTVPAEVRMGLVATGRFLTIFAASLLRFPTRRLDLKVLPVELPLARVPNGIVTLKNRTLSPVARLFIEHAREVAKPLAKKAIANVRLWPKADIKRCPLSCPLLMLWTAPPPARECQGCGCC